ncbi:MAG: sugar ABC transporter permease [Anaeroplasmataceae bacterium]|nr:sugar ABC transporter permease [Anaeroplasmataceae bacterium]MDE6415088.1 sugar ABC transporter permease [Anaeroplasmataceae bacterium]
MKKNNWKAWLYLLPAILLLGVFMLYPLLDVVIYSFEENFTFVSQTYTGVGVENYQYVLKDPDFLSAVKNSFIILITVPISTLIAILLAVGLNSIKPLRKIFQTIFFLPYVTNTLAVGLVFLIIFDKTPMSNGLANMILGWFHINPIDFIRGPYWAKMLVLGFYIIWTVMPFKILVLVGALQSVNKQYYDAAKLDNASRFTMFRKITVPMISPMISYLIITGFIGAFKEYNNAVALFGEDLNSSEMNTIVGYVYNMLYFETGGYPSYASAAAILLFCIILTITCINLLISKKKVYY